MTQSARSREIIKTAGTEFGAYEFIEPPPANIGFLPLSYEKQSHQGAYMMRMLPGAATEVHTHSRREEYYIIEGELIESDGTILGPGDFVIYQPGSVHNSRTEKGCLILAIDYKWDDDSPG